MRPKDVEDLKEKMELCEKKKDWDLKKVIECAKTKYNPEKYADELIQMYLIYV